jgi:hypothetical protein
MLENSKGARKMNGQSRDSCKVGHRHTTKTKQKQKPKPKNKENKNDHSTNKIKHW